MAATEAMEDLVWSSLNIPTQPQFPTPAVASLTQHQLLAALA
jgi:hypothetical protein